MTAVATIAPREPRLSDAELAALLDYCIADAPSEDGFYRTVVERLKEVVFKADIRGRWQMLNAAWARITGFQVAESLGHCILDFVHPENRDECLNLFRALIARKQDSIHCELRYITRSGEYKWAVLDAYALLDLDGIPEALAGTLTCVSDRRHAEKSLNGDGQLFNNLAREKELDHLRSQFVSMASHELRTPLSTLTLGLDFLTQYWQRLSPEVIEQNLGTVQEGARRLNRILDELPMLGRSEDGRMNCKTEETAIAELLTMLAGEPHQNRSNRKRIKICCEPPDLRAVVDPQLITHIVLNLISNACKYSDESHSVTVKATMVADALELCVTDSGCGIPEEDQSRIQNLLSKEMNAESLSACTGFGLMVVKRCVDAHNGSILFVSSTGEGSCFTVRLPVKTLSQ